MNSWDWYDMLEQTINEMCQKDEEIDSKLSYI